MVLFTSIFYFTLQCVAHCSLHHIVFYLGFNAFISALVCLTVLHIWFFWHACFYLFMC